MPVPTRHKALAHRGCPLWAAWRIARRFHRLSAASGWVAYALRTRPPLSPPRRGDPARLACIRPAASVHPEPGSNSSLYYCCTSKIILNLGFRYTPALSRGKVLPCFLLSRFAPMGLRLCAGLRLSKNLLPCSLAQPQFPSESGCKSTTFSHSDNDFFQKYFFKPHMLLIVKKKKFQTKQKSCFSNTYIIYIKDQNQ